MTNATCLHKTGPYHPEVPGRLLAIREGIEQGGLLEHLIPVQAVPAASRVDSRRPTRRVRQTLRGGLSHGKQTLDSPDNQNVAPRPTRWRCWPSAGSWRPAVRIMLGRLDNAFCAVRRPATTPSQSRDGVLLLQQRGGRGTLPPRSSSASAGGDRGLRRCTTATAPSTFRRRPRASYYYSIHQHRRLAYPGPAASSSTAA